MARWVKRLVVVGTAAALLFVAGLVFVLGRGDDAVPASVAAQAAVTASSVAESASLRGAVEPGTGTGGWRSKTGDSVGAWIQLDWPQAQTLRSVEIERSTLDTAGATAGFLAFSDNSRLQLSLSSFAASTVVAFQPRDVTSMRFTVTAVDDGATAVQLVHLDVDQSEGDVATDAASDGDVAPTASLSTSPGSRAGSAALVDHTPTDVGDSWAVAQPEGAWVQLDWPRPRELAAISLAGAVSPATLASGTLQFSDGSSVPVGAVLPNPRRPTVIAFMPRVTTSVRLTLDEVSGPGTLRLSELSVYQRHGPALEAAGGEAETVKGRPVDCRYPFARPSAEVGIVVTCPTTGAVVADRTTVDVATATSYTSVTAEVWPGDPEAEVPAAVEVSPTVTGRAALPLDLSTLPDGPLTVHLTARGPGAPPTATNFQLFKRGRRAPTQAGVVPIGGRSLVYREEFTRPISISRDGVDADYSAAKPEASGAAEFGEAIFADPRDELGNLRVVADDFLRVSVQPNPPGYTDPAGYGRQYVGGLLASARPGGSGFSAQYGFFEARMLVPGNPGTWPAFWSLSNPGLVRPQEFGSEIDAVEHYGHNPRATCSTTHQYPDPDGVGVAQCKRRWATEREALTWHTYGVLVDPDRIRFYIDGKQVEEAPQVKGGGEPQFFMVNLALGGGWPVDLASTQGRAALYVDYIRVYV